MRRVHEMFSFVSLFFELISDSENRVGGLISDGCWLWTQSWTSQMIRCLKDDCIKPLKPLDFANASTPTPHKQYLIEIVYNGGASFV